jgi:hypothetical protein
MKTILTALSARTGAETHIMAALESVVARGRVSVDTVLSDVVLAANFACVTTCRVLRAFLERYLGLCALRTRFRLVIVIVNQIRRNEPQLVGKEVESNLWLVLNAVLAVTDPRAPAYVPPYYLYTVLDPVDGAVPIPRLWIVDHVVERLRPAHELFRLCCTPDSIRAAVSTSHPFAIYTIERTMGGPVTYPAQLSEPALPLARLYMAAVRHALETGVTLNTLVSIVKTAPQFDGVPPAFDRAKRAIVRPDMCVRQVVAERIRMLAIVDRIHDASAAVSASSSSSGVLQSTSSLSASATKPPSSSSAQPSTGLTLSAHTVPPPPLPVTTSAVSAASALPIATLSGASPFGSVFGGTSAAVLTASTGGNNSPSQYFVDDVAPPPPQRSSVIPKPPPLPQGGGGGLTSSRVAPPPPPPPPSSSSTSVVVVVDVASRRRRRLPR